MKAEAKLRYSLLSRSSAATNAAARSRHPRMATSGVGWKLGAAIDRRNHQIQLRALSLGGERDADWIKELLALLFRPGLDVAGDAPEPLAVQPRRPRPHSPVPAPPARVPDRSSRTGGANGQRVFHLVLKYCRQSRRHLIEPVHRRSSHRHRRGEKFQAATVRHHLETGLGEVGDRELGNPLRIGHLQIMTIGPPACPRRRPRRCGPPGRAKTGARLVHRQQLIVCSRNQPINARELTSASGRYPRARDSDTEVAPWRFDNGL